MAPRVAIGLLASGGLLFLTGAVGLTAAWTLVTGTLLLTAASLLIAVVLEARGPSSVLEPPPAAELPRLESAA